MLLLCVRSLAVVVHKIIVINNRSNYYCCSSRTVINDKACHDIKILVKSIMRPANSPCYKTIAYFLVAFVVMVIVKYTHDLDANINYLLEKDMQREAGNLRNRNTQEANAAVAEQNILPPRATIIGTRVSYVTSFWAKVKGEEENPHRREVEAALLANIHNWHFDQVVVFLDRTEDAESCVDFHQRILDLSHEFLGTSKSRANELLAKKLQCVDVQTGQPTYYEMFQNALSDVVTGDVVVMSNGDIAFDDTVSLARHMNPEVLMVLGTSGFSNAMPHNVRQVYESMMGTDYMTNEELQKDHPASSWEINRCVRTASSWDTWIFHKNKLQGRLKEEYFQRLRLDDEMAFFYMNENGAENAALWAIEQAYRFSSSYNACDRIQSWHFHLTPKMHKVRETLWRGNKGKVFNIQKPWGFAPKNPDCFRTGSCFLKLE